ncbi:MAG: hypothetical protein K0S45_200 [Nitrospira sp.]|jgi:hypothetical protein|nr:hypothetical protein [Nitrospira sp.]
MKNAMTFMVAMVICALAQGCGAKSDNFYLNSNHQLITNTSKLVILPIGSADGALADSAFEKAFEPQRESLVPLRNVRAKISNDNTLTTILGRDIQQEHSRAGSDQSPNLREFSREIDLPSLREKLDSADIMLLPLEFDFREVMGYTTGHFKYRFYDLRSGSLLFENHRDLSVNVV